jgi:hypothetical protein
MATSLLQLLKPGAEDAIPQALSASPDLVVVVCLVWALVAGLAMFAALARAGVR